MSAAVHVVFGSDEGYARNLAVALASTAENSTDATRLRFWVLGSGLSPPTVERLRALAARYGAGIGIVDVDPGSIRGLPTRGYLNETTYLRFLVGERLPDDVERVVYLDCDLVVTGRIEDLFESDLEGRVLGAVENPGFDLRNRLGREVEGPYFNNGVLVVDLAGWREQGIGEEIFGVVESIDGPGSLPSQDSMNAVFENAWTPLDPRWNQQTSFFRYRGTFRTTTRAAIRRALESPFVVHYTGVSKPWEYLNTHPFREHYFRYLERTPWRGYRPRRSPAMIAKRWIATSRIGERLDRYPVARRWLEGRTGAGRTALDGAAVLLRKWRERSDGPSLWTGFDPLV